MLRELKSYHRISEDVSLCPQAHLLYSLNTLGQCSTAIILYLLDVHA